jgi:hypothetical protein
LIEHLIHATVLDPPPDTAPAEIQTKITALAVGYLTAPIRHPEH